MAQKMKLGKLGKLPYEHDERTLSLARYVLPEIRVPGRFDFDRHRKPLPNRMWGNDKWGCCVVAGEANQLLRFERIEQRGTILLTDSDVIDRYKALSGAVAPGDTRDTGLVILQAMKDWRANGFPVVTKTGVRHYKIIAYGELEPNDHAQMRMGLYVLHGVHIGLWLPRAAQTMAQEGVWHYEGQSGPEWEPGGWGGHLVYSKAYDEGGYEILTWGGALRASNEFVAKYADEAWACVDSLDDWRVKQTIDVDALVAHLQQITSKVNV
jgi:hypothetical protein